MAQGCPRRAGRTDTGRIVQQPTVKAEPGSPQRRAQDGMPTPRRLLTRKLSAQYLSIGLNAFDSDVRPFLTEIPFKNKILFDRLDLDAYVDDYKQAVGRPGQRSKQWPRHEQERQVSRTTTASNGSEKPLSLQEARNAWKRALEE